MQSKSFARTSLCETLDFESTEASTQVVLSQDLAETVLEPCTTACTNVQRTNSDLEFVVATWPRLTEPLRRGILAMISTIDIASSDEAGQTRE